MKFNTLGTLTVFAMLTSSGLTIAHDERKGHSLDVQAFGAAGDAAKVTRTISIDMGDNMRFSPANVQAKQGETIRFVIKNSGKIKHEFVLGTAAALKEHYEVMKKFPDMEHFDPNMVTLAPSQTGEIVWQFSKSGKVEFACLQPGHYEAGMKGSVTVTSN